ncbi:MAG: cyclic nucleotide-binding domain-containing protein [Verrucomicrobiota bacterium]
MTNRIDPAEIPLARRVVLLKTLPSFDALAPEVLEGIANSLGEERFDSGVVIMHESQFGNLMYLIESGVVDVSTDGPTGEVQLGKLGEGDRFGEVSFQSSTRRRRATVRALTPVVTLTLRSDQFERIAALYPDIRTDLACAASAFMQARLEALMGAKAQKMDGLSKSPLGF